MKQNQKPCIKAKKLIDRGIRIKTLSEVKPVEKISKTLESFLEISPMQKEVVSSHQGLSHIEQECQESLIQEKIHIQ